MGILAVSPTLLADTEQQVIVSTAELQAAIEAFGVVPSEAEQATQVSIEMIEKMQQPAEPHQEIATIPDNLLDLAPF